MAECTKKGEKSQSPCSNFSLSPQMEVLSLRSVEYLPKIMRVSFGGKVMLRGEGDEPDTELLSKAEAQKMLEKTEARYPGSITNETLDVHALHPVTPSNSQRSEL